MCPPPLSRGCGLSGRGPILQFLAQQFLPALIMRAPRAAGFAVIRRSLRRLKRYLIVHEISNGTIEIRCVGTVKHHVQIVVLPPSCALTKS
jgi:hypothetical protein